jgi:hypothetical protein
MSFLASDTLIAVPGGSTPVSKLKIGDVVLAWTPGGIIEQSVIFSSGVDAGQRLTAMFITTESSTLIVGPEEKMLLEDQTLKMADQLIPLKDRLLKSDGGSEEIKEITWAQYDNGGYLVAIAGEDNLIIAAGFVCGDYKKFLEG